jgi:hypothetical protein
MPNSQQNITQKLNCTSGDAAELTFSTTVHTYSQTDLQQLEPETSSHVGRSNLANRRRLGHRRSTDGQLGVFIVSVQSAAKSCRQIRSSGRRLPACSTRQHTAAFDHKTANDERRLNLADR